MLNKTITLLWTITLKLNVFTASSYIIRPVQKSDINQIQQTYKAVASTSKNLALRPHEITCEYVSTLVSDIVDYGLGLVVESDGQIIGWMLKQRYHIETSRHVLYSGNISIHPDYQGKGIGSQLIQAFLHEVATNHHDILRVEIFAAESNPAQHLYRRLGFVDEGIFKNAKIDLDGKLKDYYTMTWFNPNYKYA